MDAIDKKILLELQSDGRLSVTELAERVGLSLSPCHRRVKALERSGAIQDYRAQLDPAALGFNFSALIFITMGNVNQEMMIQFENSVVDIPEIIDAQRLFGDPDYMLSVVAKDLEAYRVLYDERLSAMPGVRRLTSTLVMKNVIQKRALPI